MLLKNVKLGVLGFFLILFTISTPFWSCYGLVSEPNQEIVQPYANKQELNNLAQYNLQPAPNINSFFEKYNDDYIHTESYLPEEISATSIYTDYDRNLVANIDLSKVAYSAGELVEYIVQVTSDMDQAALYPLRILIIEGDNYYYWYSGYGEYDIIQDFYVTTDSNGFYEGSFLPPVSGSYTILVIPYLAHDYPIARRVVTVSPISAFWRVPYASIREVNTLSYVLVANTSDFSPIENANVTLYVENWYGSPIDNNFTRRELYSGVSSSDGMVVLNYTLDQLVESFSCLILEVEYYGTTIDMKNYIWSYYDYSYYERKEYQLYDFITTLDKPIYTPGDYVKTRTLVLIDNYWEVSKESVSNLDVEVKLLTPTGFILYHQLLTTDANGLIEWSYHFDVDTKIGDYILVFTKGASTEKVVIEVKEYVKPDFWVEIELESEYVEPRDYIIGTVVSEYYFGKPVIGTVEIEFLYYDIVMDKIDGTLDSDGNLSFEWRVPRNNPVDDQYPIEALVIRTTVTDTINRVVSAEKDVVCTSDLIAYLWTYPWELFQRGDTIRAYFYAYQISVRNEYYWYSYNPVSDADVTITVFGTGILERLDKLFVLESKTNMYGSGSESFTIPEEYYEQYDTYVVEIVITTSDGRSVAVSQSLSLAVIETHVELNPSTNINPGDDLSLTISVVNMETGRLETAEVSIFIMDAEYDSIYYTWDYLLDGSESFTISLSDFAPNGRYRINTYCRILNPYASKYSPRYSSHYLTFTVGDDYSLSILTDKEEYTSSEDIVISGELVGSTNLPIVIELIKKGIVDIFTFEAASTFMLTLDDIKQLGPKLSIFAYAITPTGIILEAVVMVEITHDINIQIETDKEIYEPGETAQVTITITDENNEPIDALSVFSMIDSSIFAVKEDELKEENYFEDEYYWPQLSTRCSWTAPMTFWWYWWVLEDYYQEPIFWGPTYTDELATFGGEDAFGTVPAFAGDIRDYLPESANWLPSLEIKDGELTFDIPLPDNIGEWTIRLFTYADGIGKISKKTFKTFLPFFVDLKLPSSTVQDNVVLIRGIAYNYLDDESIVTLTLEADDLTLLNNPVQEVIIPKDYLVEVTWTVYCDNFGDKNITLTGAASIGPNNWYDGIRKSLHILPNGVPVEFIQSGFINETEEITFEIFEESIYNNVELIISPGIMETALTSWNRLIGYPYGCIEQTMSKVFPDVMIYHYLNQSGQLTVEIKQQLEDMLQVGLSKIASNQHYDGGWGWWSDDASQTYMTAVVLYGLGLMSSLGFELSPQQLAAGIFFLLDQQQMDGSFTTNNWRLDDFSFTSYVIRALLAIKKYNLEPTIAIQNAINYFESNWVSSPEDRNPYAAALYIEATYDTTYYSPTFVNDLITYILGEAIVEEDGLRWEITSDQYYRALGGTVETTSTVITALTLTDYMAHFVTIRSALNWLMKQQHSWGWGNTADSSAAIKAIVTVAQFTSDTIECTIDLSLNAWNDQLVYNESESSYLTAALFDLDAYLINGNNTLSLTQVGTGQIYYYFKSIQILRSDPEIQIEDPITVAADSTFVVSISLQHESEIVYPVNIIITNLEIELPLIGPTTQTLQILLDEETIEFTYQAPALPGVYSLAGFEISYQFADETLDNLSDGIVTKTIDELTIIVENSIEPTTFKQASVKQFTDDLLIEPNDYDITITRDYSKTTDFLIGETIDVTVTIDNNWEEKEFVMIEYEIPTGFQIVTDSLNSIGSLADYYLTQSKLTLFMLKLNLGITSANFKLAAFEVGSSISLPVILSSMYDTWTVESDAQVLGTLGVKINPSTGLPSIDAIKPIFKMKSIKLTEGNKAYDVTIDVHASDNNEIKSVKVLFSDGISGWQTEEGTFQEVLSTGEEKYTVDLGSFDGIELMYIIAIEDQAGNVLFTESATLIIPAITAMIGFIIIGILVAIAFASTSMISTIKLKPKPDSARIIVDDRDTVYLEMEDDEGI
jgi:hypothetical protein